MKKIGLVLAGGGGRGAYHIGVCKALRETKLDRYVSAVSGTSVGGLNAALFLQGDIDKAEKIWKNISIEKILTPRYGAEYSAHNLEKSSGLYLCVREGLTKIIEDNLDMGIFDESEKNCYMTCWQTSDKADMDDYEEMFTYPDGKKGCKKYINGKAVYFNMRAFPKKDRLKILLATSAMPVIFPREKVDGYYYLDGGIVDNLPVEPLYHIEKCDRIVVVHLTTNDGKIEVKKFPNAKIWEIRPKKEQGGLFKGILDFNAQNAANRMWQGYDDTIDLFRRIREDIDMETEFAIGISRREWGLEENRVSEIEMQEDTEIQKEFELNRVIRNKGMTELEKDFSLLDDSDKELQEKIEGLIEGWSVDEMRDLLVECEFVLSYNEGRIEQLNVRGLKRLWHIVTGVYSKNIESVRRDTHRIQKISLEIQKILINRFDLMRNTLISLSEKMEKSTIWTKYMIYKLFWKFEQTRQNVNNATIKSDLAVWCVSLQNKEIKDGVTYLDMSDGIKVLLVVSDLFRIVHERDDLVSKEILKTALMGLRLIGEINSIDFYNDIIREKEYLSLYIKSYYDYQTGNISSYGKMIYKIAEFFSNPLLNDLSDVLVQKPEDLCLQIICKNIKNVGDKVSFDKLCLDLLKDLKCLNIIQRDKVEEQIQMGENLSIADKDAEDSSNKVPYSILRMTPEALHLFGEEKDVLKKLDCNDSYIFKDKKMLEAYLENANPYIVAAPVGYFDSCDLNEKDFLQEKICVSLSDYYMYLWFHNVDVEEVNNQKLAFIEYYDETVYVSGYVVHSAEKKYEKGFSKMEISHKKTIPNIIKAIHSHDFFSDVNKDDILIFQTFSTNLEGLYKLANYNVRMVDGDSTWENILKRDNSALENIIKDFRGMQYNGFIN